jgi:hypothetical protein
MESRKTACGFEPEAFSYFHVSTFSNFFMQWNKHIILLLAVGLNLPVSAQTWHGKERSLHYTPDGDDFVCVNYKQRFNRALYGTNTAFRVETGDLPEFALYMPGMGGNCKFGLIAGDKSKWLIDAANIKTVYRAGSMLYEIKDPLLGDAVLHITVLALSDAEGMIIKTHFTGTNNNVRLLWLFGGASGKKFSRDGDIGADPESSFYLHANNCRDNIYRLQANSFTLSYGTGKVLTEEERYEVNHLGTKDNNAAAAKNPGKKLTGIVPSAMLIKTADASQQGSPLLLFQSKAVASPVVTGTMPLTATASYFVIQNGDSIKSVSYNNIAALFNRAEATRKKLAERIKIKTPDPYINTLGAALGIAADAIWEDPTYLHGAVAWRMRLNAWRGAYTADPLGWHDRAEKHFSSYALSQIIDPVTGPIVADTALHLARQLEKIGTSLFSNGYICRNPNGDIRAHHYDMNLVFVDQLLEHFYWTGDLTYVKKMWPLLQRHLAWEKRNFDADGDGLYDAYAAIWASDALQYSGGGVTHTSAYNYRANKAGAEIAPLIGEDGSVYKKEADKILRAMNEQLWMPSNGWYAEYKDLLGLRQLHPVPGLWTIYHAIDSRAPNPLQAYQCLQYVSTAIPHIPVQANGLTEKDLYVLSTTNWQPYTWSLNNVVLAEMQHMALAYWQGNQPEEAYRLWKSSLIESMYLGAAPGGFQQLSFYDAIRGELYRDFADPIGTVSRSLVEGLFGVSPDALKGELTIKPGFPAAWDHAYINVPDVGIDFKRNGFVDRYTIAPAFSKKMRLKLLLRARRDGIASVTVNGKNVSWKQAKEEVIFPVVEINAPYSPNYNIAITWKGNVIDQPVVRNKYTRGDKLDIQFANASLMNILDVQGVLKKRTDQRHPSPAPPVIDANAGNKIVFFRLSQGSFEWSQPVSFTVVPAIEIAVDSQQKASALSFSIKNNTGKKINASVVINPGPNQFTTKMIIREDGLANMMVPVNNVIAGSNLIRVIWDGNQITEQNILQWNVHNTASASYEKIDLTPYFNDKLSNIFKQQYLSPRPATPTLQLPTQGIGNWCYPLIEPAVNDTGLRRLAGDNNEFVLPQKIPFATPGNLNAKNILFTSLWDNYPDSAVVPLNGNASHAYLLMAGSTNAMQTHMDNALVTVKYKDGSVSTLALRNPQNWWPIEEDYYIDGYAFQTGAAIPLRVYLKEGTVAQGLKSYSSIKGFSNMAVDGGAATVLDLPLDVDKELGSISVRVLTNDVVVGLMSVTLMR